MVLADQRRTWQRIDDTQARPRVYEACLSFAGMMSAVEATTEAEKRRLRADIDRLCLLGILRRGLVLNCEACGHVGFIAVDVVSSINSCVRCGDQNPLMVDRWRDPFEEPTWFYDLHGAARELLAEDSGIALLCSTHLRQSARSYADLSELKFFTLDGKAVAEIDLLASCDDKVIIGEAKSHPNWDQPKGNGTRRLASSPSRLECCTPTRYCSVVPKRAIGHRPTLPPCRQPPPRGTRMRPTSRPFAS